MSSILKGLFHKKWKCPQEDKEGLETFAFTDFLKEYLNPAEHPEDTIPDFVTNVEKIKEIIAKLTCPSIKIDQKIGELIKQMVGVIKYYSLPAQNDRWLADGNDSSDWKDRDTVLKLIEEVDDFKGVTPVEKITFFSDKEKAQKKIADLEAIRVKKEDDEKLEKLLKDAKKHQKEMEKNEKAGNYKANEKASFIPEPFPLLNKSVKEHPIYGKLRY